MALGKAVDVNSTPTLFINGQKIDGAVPISAIRAALDNALAEVPCDQIDGSGHFTPARASAPITHKSCRKVPALPRYVGRIGGRSPVKKANMK